VSGRTYHADINGKYADRVGLAFLKEMTTFDVVAQERPETTKVIEGNPDE